MPHPHKTDSTINTPPYAAVSRTQIQLSCFVTLSTTFHNVFSEKKGDLHLEGSHPLIERKTLKHKNNYSITKGKNFNKTSFIL
jgi:hypothetical protein